MPELPEVETVRRILKEDIINKKIIDIDIRYNKIIQNVKNYNQNEQQNGKKAKPIALFFS